MRELVHALREIAHCVADFNEVDVDATERGHQVRIRASYDESG